MTEVDKIIKSLSESESVSVDSFFIIKGGRSKCSIRSNERIDGKNIKKGWR